MDEQYFRNGNREHVDESRVNGGQQFNILDHIANFADGTLLLSSIPVNIKVVQKYDHKQYTVTVAADRYY